MLQSQQRHGLAPTRAKRAEGECRVKVERCLGTWLLGAAMYVIAALPAFALTSQTITFGTLANKTYGVAPFTVSATASSGLTVSFASQTPSVCTVSSTTVTVVAAGTCTIRASQAGNATYAAAPNVDRTFTVSKASQTITFTAPSGHTYGDAPFAVSATSTSGLVVTFSSTTTSVCTVSGTTITIVAAGSCTIKADQAGDSNYNAATSVSRTFTVAKAAQTITFAALSGRTYGDSPFGVSGTSTSGLAVTFSSTTTAVCTVSSTTVTIVAGGTCTIKADQAGNSNYSAATSVSRSFTVAKAAQSISFAALSDQLLSTPPFGVSATATSGLAVTFTSTTTTKCTVSGSTVTLVAAGTCTIRAAQAGNGNYSAATNVDRSFTISKASQTITFASLSARTVGDAPFAVSATASSGLTVAFSSTTTAVCTVSGTSVTLVTGGTCTIRASQAGNAQYNAASNVDQTFTVSKATQAISLDPLPDFYLYYGGANVSPVASSGLPVTLATTAPQTCTINANGSVALLARGTCSLVASQAGDASYLAAPNYPISFVIHGNLQVITFDPIGDQVMGAPDIGLAPTSSSGLVVQVSSSTPAVCAISGALLHLVAPGDCTVIATQDGDAQTDAAELAQTIHVVKGIAFAPPQAATGDAQAYHLGVGDLNGDAKLDLAVAGTTLLKAYLNAGNGTFVDAWGASAGSDFLTNALFGDFNGDGKQDLAVGRIVSKQVLVYLGNGDGTFSAPITTALATSPIALTAADLNGDGRLDIVIAYGSHATSVDVALGNGDGTFATTTSYAIADGVRSAAIADFNGDGIPDLALAHFQSSLISILIGNGAGSFSPADDIDAQAFVEWIAAVDFDGDTRPDLVVGGGNVTAILHGNGDGTFEPPVFGSGGGMNSSVADINGDGLLDVVGISSDGTEVQALLGEADGALAGPISLASTGSAFEVVVADLTRDGSADVVFDDAQTGLITSRVNTIQQNAVNTLSIASGGGQNANIGAKFSQALQAVVRDGMGDAMSGIAVTFSAPASGPSAVFGDGQKWCTVYTDPNGIARSPTLRAGVQAGTYSISVRAANLSTSLPLTNVGNGTAPAFTSGSLSPAAIGQPYSFSLTATGTPAPQFRVASGSLPPGLSLSLVTGLVSGTPSAAGSYSGVFAASNGIAPDGTLPFSVDVPALSQTITFAALTDQAFPHDPIALVATASSGLAVSFSSLTPPVCHVLGTFLSLDATGTCTVQAVQVGSVAYAPAPPITRTFNIGASAQSINFVQPSSMALNAVQTVDAQSTSGLPVTLTSLTPAICTASNYVDGGPRSIIPLAVGNCTIEASQPGDANFGAAPNVDRTFAITAATQSLAWNTPPSQPLDGPTIVLGGSSSSGLSVTFTSQTPSVCTISNNAITPVAEGTCTITIAQSGNGNYLPTSQTFSFDFSHDANLPFLKAANDQAPTVEYGTVLGGLGGGTAYGVVVGQDGAAYVAGYASSANQPGLSSTDSSNAGWDLTFVTRVRPGSGEVDFARVVGVSVPDQVEGLAMGPASDLYVPAYQASYDWPLRGGVYIRKGALYIHKVSSSGAVSIAAGPLDSAISTIRAIAVDAGGAIYITGVAAPGLATSATAAFKASQVAAAAPYVVKLSPSGTTVFATYLGIPGSRASTGTPSRPSLIDNGTTTYAIAIDSSGASYVAGQAVARDMPASSPAVDTQDTVDRDAFVSRVSPDGSSVTFTARLGFEDAERATSVALAPDGSIVVGGKTASVFSGTSADPPPFQGHVDFPSGRPAIDRETGFVAKLNVGGAAWQFIAALGTEQGTLVRDEAFPEPSPVKVAVNSAGAIYVAGRTFLPDRSLPVLNPISGSDNDGPFVMKLSADGSILSYATPLGSGFATGIAVDNQGGAYITGYSDGFALVARAGASYPLTTMPLEDRTPFVVKLLDLPNGIVLSTTTNPATAGDPLSITASMADARYGGYVEFFDGAVSLGTASVVSGTATLPLDLLPGIYRLGAIFHGAGPYDGAQAFEVLLTVNQP